MYRYILQLYIYLLTTVDWIFKIFKSSGLTVNDQIWKIDTYFHFLNNYFNKEFEYNINKNYAFDFNL